MQTEQAWQPITETMSIKPQLKARRERVSLNWTQLDAVLTGVSAIDVSSLAIRHRDDAVRFAREYGFDIDNPADYEHICQVHREAIAFIEAHFLEPHQYDEISASVRDPENVLDLLVYSSNYLNKSNVVQMWACAVLKVMHGIFHIDHDLKLRYFDQIREQIFEAIDRLIVQEGNKHYLCDDRIKLPILELHKKRNKGRRSILLKLLQKPTYVASDIYDHLGIRLIFETKMECLFALKVLRRSHLISVSNIKPFRSRNNLVDLGSTRKLFNHYKTLLERADKYPAKVLRRMDAELESGFKPTVRENNPHSDQGFQSIQVTARKMVRVPNPAWLKLCELIDRLQIGDRAVARELMHEAEVDKDLAFYFDYEIQVLDLESYNQSKRGPASHEAYKRRQIETAEKRVLSPALRKILAQEPALAST